MLLAHFKNTKRHINTIYSGIKISETNNLDQGQQYFVPLLLYWQQAVSLFSFFFESLKLFISRIKSDFVSQIFNKVSDLWTPLYVWHFMSMSAYQVWDICQPTYINVKKIFAVGHAVIHYLWQINTWKLYHKQLMRVELVCTLKLIA